MAHCKDKLAFPAHGCLTDIDLEAKVSPCHLKVGVVATHTTDIDNQRTGDIHQIEICVRPRYRGVILDGNPSLTEYKHGMPMLRSGKSWSHSFNLEQNSSNPMANDELETAVTLYDSTQVNGSSLGTSENASIKFTVDIS